MSLERVGDVERALGRREQALEAYYDVQLIKGVNAALDYQLITAPAYNADRGPISVLGLRLHGSWPPTGAAVQGPTLPKPAASASRSRNSVLSNCPAPDAKPTEPARA